MPDDIKNPPAGSPDTGKKSAEELEKELEQAKKDMEDIDKRLKEKEAFIGKQSTEIGELRKFQSENKDLIDKIKSTPSGEKKDSLIDELASELIKEGYSEEDAKQNAKILAKTSSKIIQAEFNKRMMNDVVDLLDESLDEGKLDRKVFDENNEEVMREFRGRILAPTARQNFKILKDCYQIVIRRKADEMKVKNQESEEEKRNAAINAGSPPPPAGKSPAGKDEDTAKRESILSGRPESSELF